MGSQYQVGRERKNCLDIRRIVCPHLLLVQRFWRVVAPVRNSHHLISKAQGEKNLGIGGRQGDDPLRYSLDGDVSSEVVDEMTGIWYLIRRLAGRQDQGKSNHRAQGRQKRPAATGEYPPK